MNFKDMINPTCFADLNDMDAIGGWRWAFAIGMEMGLVVMTDGKYDWRDEMARERTATAVRKDATNRTMHKHRCTCGTVWTHLDNADQLPEDEHDKVHRCPRCNKPQREVYAGRQRAGYRDVLKRVTTVNPMVRYRLVRRELMGR